MTASRPAYSFADFVERVTGRRPFAYQAALVEAMEKPRQLEDHTPDTCTCAWWYYQTESGGWCVRRICRTGFQVRITEPLGGLHGRGLEHLARDKARRLNRIYGIPDPGDAPQEQGPGTLS